jgi:hypothetical protein
VPEAPLSPKTPDWYSSCLQMQATKTGVSGKAGLLGSAVAKTGQGSDLKLLGDKARGHSAQDSWSKRLAAGPAA